MIPIGVGLVGTGAAIALTGGSTAGLAGLLVLTVAVYSVAIGAVGGIIGSGVDTYSGKAKTLVPGRIDANLRPVQPPMMR